MAEDIQVGRFLMRRKHFDQVQEHMKTALVIEVTDQVVEKFLQKNGPLLGMIVGYDEVETEARHAIWDACKQHFESNELRKN